MPIRFPRQSTFLLTVLMITSLGLVDAGAQTRRKHRSRRAARPVITNPTIAPPGEEKNQATGEEKIISTADENSASTEQSVENANTANADMKRPTSKRRPASDQEQMQQTINALSNQVTRLTDKLSLMQEDQRSLLDMERLTRAEQRAETLRAQLRDVQAKQGDMQSKLEQIEYALKPESIDRVVAVYGTTHPEEARDSRRRQLENERSRTQEQLNQLETSRVRLESAIATADAEVELLRRRLDTDKPQPGQENGTTTGSNAPPTEAPPVKDPYPPQ